MGNTADKAPASNAWTTKITDTAPNVIALRGKRLEWLMGRYGFASVMYFSQTGILPDEPTAKLLSSILVSSLDHGTTPPSTLAARTVISTGGSLQQALATGVLAINASHGGAIQGCMKILREAADAAGSGDLLESARKMISEWSAAKRRIPGFGHRYHTNDPRTGRLFELAAAAGKVGRYIGFARALERVFADELKKPLPINVDGAIAAVLLELHVPEAYGNLWFMTARLPGWALHAVEERDMQKRLRLIVPGTAVYEGPPVES